MTALRAIVEPWGQGLRVVETPPSVLHLKTDCSLVGPGTVLSAARLAATGCSEHYAQLIVPSGQEAAANALRINDTILIPAGFPQTEAMLKGAGFAISSLPNSECARLDSGMSCLSLRLNR